MPGEENGINGILGIGGLAGGGLGTGILLKIILDWLRNKKNGDNNDDTVGKLMDKLEPKLDAIKSEIHDTKLSNDRTEASVNKLVTQVAVLEGQIKALKDQD